MSVLWRMTARNITKTFAYRGAFFLLMLATMTTPVISLLVWLTVGRQGVRLPYSADQFISYFVLLSLVTMLLAAWAGQFLAADIRAGRLSPLLLRPVSPVLDTIANNLGEKVVKLPLLLPLLIVAIVAFGRFQVPSSFVVWLMFAAAIALGSVVTFALDYAFGLLAFWLDDVGGLFRLRWLVAGALSGGIVPLALLPPRLIPWVEAQPFRSTLSFPLELITRTMDGTAIARGFAYQAGWSIALLLLCRTLWRRGLRVYSAAGA